MQYVNKLSQTKSQHGGRLHEILTLAERLLPLMAAGGEEVSFPG